MGRLFLRVARLFGEDSSLAAENSCHWVQNYLVNRPAAQRLEQGTHNQERIFAHVFVTLRSIAFIGNPNESALQRSLSWAICLVIPERAYPSECDRVANAGRPPSPCLARAGQSAGSLAFPAQRSTWHNFTWNPLVLALCHNRYFYAARCFCTYVSIGEKICSSVARPGESGGSNATHPNCVETVSTFGLSTRHGALRCKRIAIV